MSADVEAAPAVRAVAPPQERSGRLWLALIFLLGLTALEVGVVGLPVDRAARITALVGLGMTKGLVLLTAFVRMGREPLILRAAILVPLLLAPGFAVALILDTAWRAVNR